MNSGVNRRELVFKTLAGLVGGAIGWVPVEITSHGHSLTEPPTLAGAIASYVAMATFSALVGGLVNAAELQTVEINPQTQRRFLWGFGICLVLSLPAFHYANAVFNYFLATGGWNVNQQGGLLNLIVGRTIAWALMGLMLGAGVGLASFSMRNVAKGAIGGWVGGFLSGIAFDPIGIGLSTSGLMSRLVGFSVTGLAIGLFIGLVQELTKAAWLTVEAGRLRGRQWRLEAAVAMLGRAEENSVGLFGDPAVLPRHAELRKQGERYVLKSLSPQQGVFVNGARIESVELNDRDLIKVGNYELRFHLRRAPLGALGGPAPAPAISSRPIAPPAPAGAESRPSLIGAEGQRFAIQRGALVRLGRALDNDIVINHVSVSRHHANIVSRDGGFALVDLNSRNGSFVDGRRLSEPAQLSDGDSVRLGDAEFTFRA